MCGVIVRVPETSHSVVGTVERVLSASPLARVSEYRWLGLELRWDRDFLSRPVSVWE